MPSTASTSNPRTNTMPTTASAVVGPRRTGTSTAPNTYESAPSPAPKPPIIAPQRKLITCMLAPAPVCLVLELFPHHSIRSDSCQRLSSLLLPNPADDPRASGPHPRSWDCG